MTAREVVIVTGSAGFVGRHFVKHICRTHPTIGFDLADDENEGLENYRFIRLDLREPKQIAEIFSSLKSEGVKISALFNLAAYYDFRDLESRNYYMLELGLPAIYDGFVELRTESGRFFQASSMSAIEPCLPGEKISAAGARSSPWHYPSFKVSCEDILRHIDKKGYRVELVIAAIYSDYAELVPLYHLIMLQKGLGLNRFFYPASLDRGLTYIHIEDLIELMVICVDQRKLPNRMMVGEDTAFTYKDLFAVTDRFFFGIKMPKIRVPKKIASIGAYVLLKLKPSSFIQPWMIYLSDEYFEFDLSDTYNHTSWKPQHNLNEDIHVILENLKTDEKKFVEINQKRPWNNEHWRQLK